MNMPVNEPIEFLRAPRIMFNARGLLLALLVVFGVNSTSAENSVHIRSKYDNQMITSSTLKWVSAENGQHPNTSVVGAIEIIRDESMTANPVDTADGEESKAAVTDKPAYICRARHNGAYLPGLLRYNKKTCQVSLHKRVFDYDKYEVLDNIDNGARLSWIIWDRFHLIQHGSVSGGEAYVARRENKEESEKEKSGRNLGLNHLIGKLDVNEGFGYIFVINEDDKEEQHSDGEVLVETEPIRYELTGIKFNHNKVKVTKEPRVLGSTQMRNEDMDSAKVDTMIAYDANYSMYWGQGRAILRGLPTIVRLANGTLLEEIKWGIPETEERKDVYRVETHLEAGTGVNVTLHGNRTKTEIPYTAKLVAVYEDGANRAREIQGSRCQVAMLDVKPIFSPVFFTGNLSLVPTTTTTTTTTTSTSTTSTSTTSTTETPTKKSAKKEETNRKKGENSSMMNDEGAEAMKKQESRTAQSEQTSSGSLFNPELLTLISGFILHRIT